MNQQQIDQVIEQHREWWETQGRPALRGEPITDPRGQRADLSGLVLSGLDLQEVYLPQAILRGTVFRDCNLSQAIMYGADLREADLTCATYCRLFVHDADLRGAKAHMADPLDETYNNILRFDLPWAGSTEPIAGTVDQRLWDQLLNEWARDGHCLTELGHLEVLELDD